MRASKIGHPHIAAPEVVAFSHLLASPPQKMDPPGQRGGAGGRDPELPRVTFQVRLDDVVHWPGTRIPLPAQFVTPLCVLPRGAA